MKHIDLNTRLSYGITPQRAIQRNSNNDKYEGGSKNRLHSVKSGSVKAYRNQSPQERKNSTIWDALAMRDYENFKREQDARVMKKREDQRIMRSYLHKQSKEVEAK